MVKRIEWTNRAITDLRQITRYLRQEASEKAAQKFHDLLHDRIARISAYPMIGRKAPRRKTVRFVLLGKHHRLYYRHSSSSVFISAIFDTRQDPDKRPF